MSLYRSLPVAYVIINSQQKLNNKVMLRMGGLISGGSGMLMGWFIPYTSWSYHRATRAVTEPPILIVYQIVYQIKLTGKFHENVERGDLIQCLSIWLNYFLGSNI